MPRNPNRLLYALGRVWSGAQGWRFEGEQCNEKKLILALAPHTTNWDFFVGVPMMLNIKARVSIMMKREAFFWPFKTLLQSVGFVPVDRGEASGIVPSAVRQFSERENFWLVITPEGTRTRGKRWKHGFLRISREAGVPIQMLAIDYPSKRFIFGPVIHASDNPEADVEICKHYFSQFKGRY